MTAVQKFEKDLLNRRWTALRHHIIQQKFYHSPYRFNVVPAGRRSGKSELAKRRLVKRGVRGSKYDMPMYGYGAPTHGQAKRIAWNDLKRLVPREAMRGKPSESELFIPLWHGGGIKVIGLDEAARVEGSPWDGFVLDEYGNMKKEVWGEHLRPSLSDREGWCDLIGVPEGRNHYFDVAEKAKADMAEYGTNSEWAFWHWRSDEILKAKEITAAKHDLDPLTYEQEYGGSFVTFQGRAYYGFTDANKMPVRKLYNPQGTLLVCLDFNVSPGVAVIAQEIEITTLMGYVPGQTTTCVIGEVYIPNNSTTKAVCKKVLTDWAGHEGAVAVYGDATGGNAGTAKLDGSDWDLVRKFLTHGIDDIKGFGGRYQQWVKDRNPRERARVNAMNSRCESADGTRKLMVDPTYAPWTIKDFDGVRVLDGGSGELDKKKDPKLTHLTDGLGYYVEFRFPVVDGQWKPIQTSW